jgi:hypothetical protein
MILRLCTAWASSACNMAIDPTQVDMVDSHHIHPFGRYGGFAPYPPFRWIWWNPTISGQYGGFPPYRLISVDMVESHHIHPSSQYGGFPPYRLISVDMVESHHIHPFGRYGGIPPYPPYPPFMLIWWFSTVFASSIDMVVGHHIRSCSLTTILV